MTEERTFLVSGDGTVTGVYEDDPPFDLGGNRAIVRASRVEPEGGRWWVFLPTGERRGPYGKRSEAIADEVRWVEGNLERFAPRPGPAHPGGAGEDEAPPVPGPALSRSREG